MHGSSSMRCPDCGKDPAVIVAYEPLGLVAELPTGRTVSPSKPPRSRLTRAQLEERVSALEAENQQLRANDPS
jgi:hypothetical protein